LLVGSERKGEGGPRPPSVHSWLWSMPWWLIFTILATVLWGASYTSLGPATGVDVSVIQMVVGVTNVLASAVLFLTSWGTAAGAREQWIILTQNYKWLYVGGYAFAAVAGSLCYLYATKQQGAPIFLITAVSSAYPLVTMALEFILFASYRRVRLQMALPGMVLIAAGCALLAFSPIADAAVLNTPAMTAPQLSSSVQITVANPFVDVVSNAPADAVDSEDEFKGGSPFSFLAS
jgi:hypothetical protein